MAVTLAQLARRIGATLYGAEDCTVGRVAPLDKAQPGDVSFLYNRKYRKFLNITDASAVIVRPVDQARCPGSALVTNEPFLAYARAASLLNQPVLPANGIHPTAWIDPAVTLPDDISIGSRVSIESGAAIGIGCVIGPGCVIRKNVSIGDYTRLDSNVTLCSGTTIGRRVIIHPGVVIGGDGFGFARDGEAWLKIPQTGRVCIGDDVEIGANTTVDRGELDDTIIESGVKLDNLCQIGHNVKIGANTVIAGCVGIAGSTVIGKHCTIGGGVGITGHIQISDGVTLTGMSAVSKSIRTAGSYSSGWPARESSVWRRMVSGVSRLARNEQKQKGV